MEGLLYALLSVIATALLRLTLKHCAVNSTSAWGTLILYHIGGALVLLPFLGLPDLSILSQEQIILLIATGALFSLAALLDIWAMKHIDASAGEIFHTLTFIVSVAAGLLMFHEACSLSKVTGTCIIAAGILYEARRALTKASHGFWLKLASAALIATAMIITKQLTTNTPSEFIILFSGFVVPGFIYTIIGWRDLREVPSVIRDSHGVILIVPVLDATSYAFGIKALAAGEMSTTYIIFQTTISAVFIFEVMLHGWRKEVYLHRAVSAGLCMCGALVAILS
jgi:drug/metabolite transporter (DMT)-like permease